MFWTKKDFTLTHDLVSTQVLRTHKIWITLYYINEFQSRYCPPFLFLVSYLRRVFLTMSNQPLNIGKDSYRVVIREQWWYRYVRWGLRWTSVTLDKTFFPDFFYRFKTEVGLEGVIAIVWFLTSFNHIFMGSRKRALHLFQNSPIKCKKGFGEFFRRDQKVSLLNELLCSK